MSELIYYALDTDRAFRADKSELANTNLPECVYKQQNKDLDLQFLNTEHEDEDGDFDDFFTGHAALGVTGSAAADNNWNHVSTAKLNSTLTISVPVSEFNIKEVGSDFDPVRPAGTIVFANAENVNYNAITDNGDDTYTLQTADGNFGTSNFTPTASHAVNEVLSTRELPIIKDPLIDVTDKATGLYHIAFDCYNSIYQALAEGNSAIEDCIFEIQIFDGGVPILVKQFDIALMALLDDDGGVAPAPLTGYYSMAASDSRYVRQALTTAYTEASPVAGTMKVFVRDGSASKYATIDGIQDYIIGTGAQMVLLDNQANDLILGAIATYRAFEIFLTVEDDGVGDNIIKYKFTVGHDGTNAVDDGGNAMIIKGAEFSGVAITSIVSGGNAILRITLTGIGSSLRCVWEVIHKLIVYIPEG